MALGTLHPQKAVFQPAAFEVIGKFLFDMQGQGLALLGHHIPKRRVILIEQAPVKDHKHSLYGAFAPY
jgi:hypothetical protein